MTTIFIGPFQNGMRLVHKLGCNAMPNPSQCTESVGTNDPTVALAKAKNQVPGDEKILELCPQCW